jgi:hypothetical protein
LFILQFPKSLTPHPVVLSVTALSSWRRICYRPFHFGIMVSDRTALEDPRIRRQLLSPFGAADFTMGTLSERLSRNTGFPFPSSETAVIFFRHREYCTRLPSPFPKRDSRSFENEQDPAGSSVGNQPVIHQGVRKRHRTHR